MKTVDRKIVLIILAMLAAGYITDQQLLQIILQNINAIGVISSEPCSHLSIGELPYEKCTEASEPDKTPAYEEDL